MWYNVGRERERRRACMSPERLQVLRAREARLKRQRRARETDEEKALRRSQVAQQARERRAKLGSAISLQKMGMHHFMELEERTDLYGLNERDPLASPAEWVNQESSGKICSLTKTDFQQREEEGDTAGQTIPDKGHAGEKSGVSNMLLECDICRKVLSSKGYLRLHKIRKHGFKAASFSCKICGNTMSHRKELIQHCDSAHRRVVDGMFECIICEKLLPEYDGYVAHTKVHGRCKVRTKPQAYVCEECGKVFKRLYSLRNHQLLVHLLDGGLTVTTSRQQVQEKRFICPTCGKRFPFQCLLRDHLNVHSGAKPYHCQECGRTFAQRASMKQHARTHGATRPFSCPDCSLSFFTRGDMNKHMRRHTGERPFVCEICGETYAQSNHLSVHRRSHTGERPFTCDLCGRGFTKSSDVLRHRRIHTGELPFLCQVCGKGFRQSAQCANHIKNRHPETVSVE